ncbi:MAG: DUF4166 domain-containing protein [Candidatus Binataceae bacterium]
MWRAVPQRRINREIGSRPPTPHGSFRGLVSAEDWRQLPGPVRARFERELAPGELACFAGELAETRMTMVGRLWAQIARLIGAPLPLKALARTAAAVVVTQDALSATQAWTRLYHENGKLPQVIRSTKRFAGPTGLEECVSAGIGMTLAVSVEQRALVFRSTEYFWRCGSLRFRIPEWLTPGHIAVIHREERTGRFSFTLIVTHPWFGETIRQVGFFRDAC